MAKSAVSCSHDNTRVVYFHHVGKKIDHYTSISTGDFCKALDLLMEAASIVDIREYISGKPCERRQVIITLDDGYAETIESVMQPLSDRGITACFFVVPSWFGHRAPHSWAPDRLVCADASTLRDVQADGHAIASHTWSHRHLDQLSELESENEIALAANALREQGLGTDTTGLIAYPYGMPPISASNIRAGFCTSKGPNHCLRCSPAHIRRLFLHSANQSDWKQTIESWW